MSFVHPTHRPALVVASDFKKVYVASIRDVAPESRAHRVELHELWVNYDETVHLKCSLGFLNVLRSRFGFRLNSQTSVYGFDFFPAKAALNEVGVYEGRPSDDAAQDSDAESVAGGVLSMYRSGLLFDKVFAAIGSFDDWVKKSGGRNPSHQDVLAMAKARSIGVPYLTLPFRGLSDNLTRSRKPRVPHLHGTISTDPAIIATTCRTTASFKKEVK